jgi:hypothetical protein
VSQATERSTGSPPVHRAAPDPTKDPSSTPSDPDPDLLAAVVLHTLIQAGPAGATLDQTIAACERDPTVPSQRTEIERALESLSADGLACRRGVRVSATRAALRADSLSF